MSRGRPNQARTQDGCLPAPADAAGPRHHDGLPGAVRPVAPQGADLARQGGVHVHTPQAVARALGRLAWRVAHDLGHPSGRRGTAQVVPIEPEQAPHRLRPAAGLADSSTEGVGGITAQALDKPVREHRRAGSGVGRQGEPLLHGRMHASVGEQPAIYRGGHLKPAGTDSGGQGVQRGGQERSPAQEGREAGPAIGVGQLMVPQQEDVEQPQSLGKAALI